MSDHDEGLIEKAKHAVQRAFPYALPIDAGVIEHYVRAVLDAVADDLRAEARDMEIERNMLRSTLKDVLARASELEGEVASLSITERAFAELRDRAEQAEAEAATHSMLREQAESRAAGCHAALTNAEAKWDEWREKAALHEHGYCEHSIEHNGRLSRRLAATEAALSRVLAGVEAAHRKVPMYPHEEDCLLPADHEEWWDFDGEFCPECAPNWNACETCRDDEGNFVEWPCETATILDEHRLPAEDRSHGHGGAGTDAGAGDVLGGGEAA